jgi:hypothetical protein
MDDEARDRTIEQAEADAQAMVGELERLVAQLRLERDASVGARTAPAPQAARLRHGRLVPLLGLAAVAIVGIVGAAAVTAMRDTVANSEGTGTMEPIPYSLPAAASASADGIGTPLPLGSGSLVAGVVATASATPTATGSPAAAASGAAAAPAAANGGHRPARRPRSAMDGSSALSELDLYTDQLRAQMLEQAELQAEQQAAELQALAQNLPPMSPLPQLPAYGGRVAPR